MAHLQSPFEAASRGEPIDRQLRGPRQRTIVKRNEETAGKASSAAPTRGNRRERDEAEETKDVTDSLLKEERVRRAERDGGTSREDRLICFAK